jgi:hypothetical protein
MLLFNNLRMVQAPVFHMFNLDWRKPLYKLVTAEPPTPQESAQDFRGAYVCQAVGEALNVIPTKRTR